MGGRLLRAWLLRPLSSLERIRDRLDAVEELAFRSTDRGKLREVLKAVHDLERLVARAALGTAGPRDLVALRQSIAAIPRVKLLLDSMQATLRGARCGDARDSATCATRSNGADRRNTRLSGTRLYERGWTELDELRASAGRSQGLPRWRAGEGAHGITSESPVQPVFGTTSKSPGEHARRSGGLPAEETMRGRALSSRLKDTREGPWCVSGSCASWTSRARRLHVAGESTRIQENRGGGGGSDVSRVAEPPRFHTPRQQVQAVTTYLARRPPTVVEGTPMRVRPQRHRCDRQSASS